MPAGQKWPIWLYQYQGLLFNKPVTDFFFFFFFDWEEIFLKSRTNHGSLSREEECLTLNQNYEETGMKINRKIVKGEKKEESEAQTTSKYIEMVKLTRCQRNAR